MAHLNLQRVSMCVTSGMVQSLARLEFFRYNVRMYFKIPQMLMYNQMLQMPVYIIKCSNDQMLKFSNAQVLKCSNS